MSKNVNVNHTEQFRVRKEIKSESQSDRLLLDEWETYLLSFYPPIRTSLPNLFPLNLFPIIQSSIFHWLLLFFRHTCFFCSVLSYLLRTFFHSFLSSYLDFIYPYLLASIPFFSEFLPTSLPSYLPPYLLTYLPTFLSSFLSSYLLSYLPTSYLSVLLSLLFLFSTFIPYFPSLILCDVFMSHTARTNTNTHTHTHTQSIASCHLHSQPCSGLPPYPVAVSQSQYVQCVKPTWELWCHSNSMNMQIIDDMNMSINGNMHSLSE